MYLPGSGWGRIKHAGAAENPYLICAAKNTIEGQVRTLRIHGLDYKIVELGVVVVLFGMLYGLVAMEVDSTQE